MLKKGVCALLTSALMISAIGCMGSAADVGSNAEVAFTEVMGDNLKYDPNEPVNNGADIELEFWAWDFIDTFQKLIDQYESIHPNVTIALKEVPWQDYWTKLPLVLDSKDAPALFAVHNSYHDNIINYMEPYDIPIEELEKDFIGIDSHIIDGEVYYMDMAMMTANLYYNKDMWEQAGLTDADFPKTWDEVREIAKKLTIKDGDQFVQAGFNFNGTFNEMVLGLNYQLGQNLFIDDKTVTLNNDAMNQIVSYFVDLYEKDGVGSQDFGETAGKSFGQGQTAMIAMWGYYYNTLRNNYPDLNFGVLEIPTFSENKDEVYAFNRYNGESSIGIGKNASSEQIAVAQDFVKFSLANDDFLTEYSVRANCYPTKYSLADRQEIKEHPVLNALAENIDHYIWPGTIPNTVIDNVRIAGEDILYNGMAIPDALEKAEETINEDLKTVDFLLVENAYKYAE